MQKPQHQRASTSLANTVQSPLNLQPQLLSSTASKKQQRSKDVPRKGGKVKKRQLPPQVAPINFGLFSPSGDAQRMLGATSGMPTVQRDDAE